VGLRATAVAVIGVICPFALAFVAMELLANVGWLPVPEEVRALMAIFVGATLTATSVGITARVLQDLGRMHTQEARVLIGAAVIDDVLGLVVLAIVSGIAVTGAVQLADILRTSLLAALFIGTVLLLGPHLIRALIRLLRHLDEIEAKMFVSFVFVMALAWAANLVGLATIVGAFAAGLLLMDSQFEYWECEGCRTYQIKELFAPLEAILVPIFFVLIGLQVKLESFLDAEVLLFASGLTVAAIVGKVVCGVVAGGGLNRLAIGIGMLPDLPLKTFKALGNSSLGGATLLLTSDCRMEEIDRIRDRITYLELNVNQDFMNRFSAAKFLPHTDRSRFPSVHPPIDF